MIDLMGSNILPDSEIESRVQLQINRDWPQPLREKALRIGGQLKTDLDAYFDNVATPMKATAIADRNLLAAAIAYEQAIARLAKPALNPADYPDVEGATNPALVIDAAERTAAQAVVDGASQAVLDLVAARAEQ